MSEMGQALPPVPRQPGVQRLMLASQTRPEVEPPQSGSTVQPHWPPARHWAPAKSARHSPGENGMHSVHVFVVGSQTRAPPQSALTRHCTQRPRLAEWSQRGSGSRQSILVSQPIPAPAPPVEPPVP